MNSLGWNEDIESKRLREAAFIDVNDIDFPTGLEKLFCCISEIKYTRKERRSAPLISSLCFAKMIVYFTNVNFNHHYCVLDITIFIIYSHSKIFQSIGGNITKFKNYKLLAN